MPHPNTTIKFKLDVRPDDARLLLSLLDGIAYIPGQPPETRARIAKLRDDIVRGVRWMQKRLIAREAAEMTHAE